MREVAAWGVAMSRWVRLWEDMPNDPKWRVVRYRALQSVTCVTIGDVVSVFVHMLTNADSHGHLVNWCDEDIAAALEYTPELVKAIREAMQGKVLEGNYLKGWEKRQPKREDNSKDRVRAFREKSNAQKRTETQCNAPEEKRIDTDTDTEKKEYCPKKFGQRALSEKMEFEKEEFKQFWTAYGHKAQRKRAEQPLRAALAKTNLKTILAGVKRYHETRPSWQQIALAASWLNGERWNDQPALKNGHDPPPVGEPQIFVMEDTPQWNAWEPVYRKSHGKPPPKITQRGTMNRGWYFPTEWPPDHQQSES